MKPNYRFSRSLLIGVAVILLTGVSGMAAEIDGKIESAAKGTYVFRTYLKDDNIKAQSKDGQVTLTGVVADEKHKSLAQETVANLPGVTGVDNQLQVKAEEPEKNTDAWVGIQVKTALLFHSNVSGTRTQVDVKEGVVTLSGEADSQAQKDLEAQATKVVENLKNGMVTADTNREILAVIAYLQRLGADIKLAPDSQRATASTQ